MAHKSTPPLLTTPHPSHPLLWPTRAISLLLLLQAMLIFTIIWYYFSRVDWEQIDIASIAGQMTISSFVLRPLTEAMIYGGVFLPFAILLLMSMAGFIRLRRAAWLLAMVCQCGILLSSLLIYFDSNLRLSQSNMLYLLMLLSILLVLYLNSSDVRVAFDTRRQQAPEEWLERLELEKSDEITYLPLMTFVHDPEDEPKAMD